MEYQNLILDYFKNEIKIFLGSKKFFKKNMLIESFTPQNIKIVYVEKGKPLISFNYTDLFASEIYSIIKNG
jgi:hypothetical protein